MKNTKTMIIKRRKNVEERLFAEINCKEDLISQDYFIDTPLEIMKCIEMYDFERGRFIDHWVHTKIVSTKFKEIRKLNISPQTLLIGVTGEKDKIISGVLSNKLSDLLLDRYNSLDLYPTVEHKLLTDSGSNSYEQSKYDVWFRNNPIQLDKDTYTLIFRYIALCLSGQVNPKNVVGSFWEDLFQITKEKINYNVNKFRAEDELDKLFYNILYSIKCYYSGIIQPENL